MRHSLLLAFAFMLTLASACKKEDDDQSIPYVPPYRVSGVVDFSIQKYSFGADPHEMYVQVEYENGEQERVMLSLEGVPSGLEDSISITSGYPSFSSFISFVDSGVTEGSYTIKLVVTGERSGRREFPFTVRVLPEPDCASPLVGSYTTNSTCTGSASYTMTVEASPTVKNKVFLNNLFNMGTQIYGQADCQTGGGGLNTYITIPSQDVNGITYSGYGYYTANSGQPRIQLSVQRSGFGTCTSYLVR